MKRNKIFSLSLILCILATLLLQIATPIVGYAEESLYVIDNAEEFLSFAKRCSYDAWSNGKVFTLNADISLEGVDFKPIPTFNGVFDGNGHTISGISLDDSYSPAGLFAYTGKDAVIKNLTVKATIVPDGDKNAVGGIVGSNSGRIEGCDFSGTVIGKGDVGGIVGINLISGTISGCKAAGEIVSERAGGGIAGTNNGLITDCVNNAKINTICVTPEISLDDINGLLTLDITKLPSLSNVAMTDSGGIAGYSNGMILGCSNLGNVGYDHVGYNVGGIVGRNCGHIASCKNAAKVLGRKDVGGIVGQMESDISYNISDDLVTSLLTELGYLGDAVNDAANRADGDISAISERIDKILAYISDATASLDIIVNESGELTGGIIIEVNRTSEILLNVMSSLSEIMEDVPEISASLGNGLGELEDAISSMKEGMAIGAESISDVLLALEDASEAFDKIDEGAKSVDAGISALRSAIEIDDIDEARDALTLIQNGLSTIIAETDIFAESLGRVASLIDESEDLSAIITDVKAIADSFSVMASAMSEIYDATTEIKNNISIHWSDIEDGRSEIINALDMIEAASNKLISAFDMLKIGLDSTIGGVTEIVDAISLKDEEAVKSAIRKIGEGAYKVIKSTANMSAAMFELSEALENFETTGSVSDLLAECSDGISILANELGVLAVAAGNISLGLEEIIDNIEINTVSLEDGRMAIIIGGENILSAFETIDESLTLITDGMESLSSAVDALEGAIEIGDKAEVSSALDKAYSAVGVMIDGIGDVSTHIVNIAERLEELGTVGDEISKEFVIMTDSLRSMTEALTRIRNGFSSIKSNVSFDSEEAKEGLNLILDGIFGIMSSSESIGNTLLHIADAIKKGSDASGYIIDATENLAQAMGHFSDGAYMISDTAEKIYELTIYLANVDPIQLSNPTESITAEAGKLFVAIINIEYELALLNSDLARIGDEGVETVREISAIFSNIEEYVSEMIYGTSHDKVIDSSVALEEVSSVTYGRIYGCENLGDVAGDKNIGGIAGSIGIEYTVDPEDDLSAETSLTEKKQYKIKAVIHGCKNLGDVSAKYDFAGGISGKMDFGLIYDCEAFCTVESRSGDYVGGVAGLSASDIIGCFTKCSLSGGKYVGGIIGSGVSEDLAGNSSQISDCYSMVVITSCNQYGGAISGANIGEYKNNYFVSDDLAGIDQISYKDKAEPISYEDLSKMRRLPDEFFSFTLSFVADDVVIKSLNFLYGESFGEEVFPEIPKKDGHYGYWNITDLSNLSFDTTVSVVYEVYTTAIGSGIYRENGKDAFLVQGNFTKDDVVTATIGDFPTDGLDLSGTLFYKADLGECWILTIPTDELETNKVHFLPDGDKCDIYLKVNGEWKKAETDEFGSYFVLDISEDSVQIAVVQRTLRVLPIVMIGLLGLMAIGGVAIVLIKHNKKKKNDSDKAN